MGAFRLGAPELIILLIIVLLLFGPGRIARIAGELGKGIRSFREGITPEEGKEEKSVEAKAEEK